MELALTSSPVTPADPKNANYRVSEATSTCAPASPSRRHHSGRRRTAGRSRPDHLRSARTARRSPATATSRGRTRTTTTICDGAENTKRVIAVSLDPVANTVQRNPLWFSTVISDPAPRPGLHGHAGGNGSGTGARARRSSTCTTSPRQCGGTVPGRRPTGSHDTRNTARDQVGVQQLHLRQRRSEKQPDAMGTQPRPATPARRSTSTRRISPATISAASRCAQGDHLPDLASARPGLNASPSTTGCSKPCTWATPRWRTRCSISAGEPQCPSGRRPSLASGQRASCARR